MRARNIKPGFFMSDSLTSCSPLARLLFAGLWCMADWEGRVLYRPKRIKAEILPYDEVNVEDLIQELAEAEPENPLIRLYGDAPEQPKYLWVTGFKRHQSPTQKEREKPSEIPAYRSGTIPVRSQDDPGSVPVPLITDVLNTDTGCSNSLIPESRSEDDEETPSFKKNLLKKQDSKESLHSRKEHVRLAWNKAAEKRTQLGLSKWPQCSKIPAGETGRLLDARVRDPDWMGQFEEALDKMSKFSWMEKGKLLTLLRPDTVRAILDGEWNDDTHGKASQLNDISEHGPDHDSCPVPG